jgi:hypothetical protein
MTGVQVNGRLLVHPHARRVQMPGTVVVHAFLTLSSSGPSSPGAERTDRYAEQHQ